MLIWDSSLEAADIEVNVENGITTLKGNVDAFWKKAEAANIASSVTGVLGVKNLLVVVPNEDVVDEVIAKDIISALRRSGKVNPENLNIKVKNGKVTLSGTVPSRKAFEAAYEAALYTTGVVEVDNNLVIQ
jgi:osmotically-inducible protein OsmY